MATFAKASFDVASYLSSRPTYPKQLFDFIFAYHAQSRGSFDRGLDLGCGPGFLALALSERFKHVVGLDPSKGMIGKALQPEPPVSPIEYAVGDGETLSSQPLVSGGVDLVVAGQAAHWFDHQKVWSQLGKVVRPGGTVAYIGYAEMTFPSFPHLNRLVSHHSGAKDQLGPYWIQPGRSIVEGLLDAVPFPVTPTTPSIDLSTFPSLDGHPAVPAVVSPEPTLPPIDGVDEAQWDASTAVRIKGSAEGRWMLPKTFTWGKFEEYMRSWSSLTSYHEAHPEDLAKRGRGEHGDIIDRLIHSLKAQMGTAGQDKIDVGWPLVVMMIKKKPPQ